MNEWNTTPFEHGSIWVRCDFHLHSKADKEFKYDDDQNEFTRKYVEKLKESNTRLGVITNHNKFDKDEFRALHKKAKKEGIGLLPGVELSVNDGANGVHTLVVFSDEWLEDGEDYINQFLGVAFAGKVPRQYENENGRSNDDLLTTLQKLEDYNRDFFIVFAHVEAPSGLWNELSGGRMEELSENPLIKKYCLGFQKVRTHDNQKGVCRTKVKGWWRDNYPAEVEGSDPKKIEEIGRGKNSFLKLGDFSFDAVKYALTDFKFRVSTEIPPRSHSYIKAIRFEGGVLDNERIVFSPHLNCLIGIRGSGKSSILEALRYGLNIELGEISQDKNYKKDLIPHILKSGGKVVVEAVDKHGNEYEVRRILKEQPDVYVDDELRPGVAINGTVLYKPLYFGQKDLSVAGDEFGQDLVEKLVGAQLKTLRQTISAKKEELCQSVKDLQSLVSDADQLKNYQDELKDIDFQLEQFEKYGVQEKLSKQVEFDKDISHCNSIEQVSLDLHEKIDNALTQADEKIAAIDVHESKHNAEFFIRYNKSFKELKQELANIKITTTSVEKINKGFGELKQELELSKESLKEEFAEIERDLVKELEKQGVTSIHPDDFLSLTQRQSTLVQEIGELGKKTSKIADKNAIVLKAIASLNEAWHEEFKVINSALSQINEAQSSLKVEAIFKGDKDSFSSKMETLFQGNNIRRNTYEKLSASYSDFGAIYKDLDRAKTEAGSKSETFDELFNENLEDLLVCQIPNKYEISYHNKPLKSHSLGQRASAMMLFILSQNENDVLLIDQPEDDLDNQTIYQEVVKLIRIIKPKQQFIFATHNANFPVLGDAELVVSCEEKDGRILIESGSVDQKEVQQRIVKIMEGGPEAFVRRKTIYQLWKADLEK